MPGLRGTKMERIEVNGVSYSYQNKYQKIEAVKEVSCTFESGKMYAITGESGSGKSTFLSLLAGLDCAESGSILINGENLSEMDRDACRRKQISVVYQAFHLFPLLTALENVMYPLELQRISRQEARRQAAKCLEEVGLEEKDHYHSLPSGKGSGGRAGGEDLPPVSQNDEWGRAAACSYCAGNGSKRENFVGGRTHGKSGLGK